MRHAGLAVLLLFIARCSPTPYRRPPAVAREAGVVGASGGAGGGGGSRMADAAVDLPGRLPDADGMVGALPDASALDVAAIPDRGPDLTADAPSIDTASPTKKAVILVTNATPSANDGDSELQAQLERRFTVTIATAGSADLAGLPEKVKGKDLIIVSEAVSSDDFKAALSTEKIPAIVLEPSVYDDWKMVVSETDGGVARASGKLGSFMEIAMAPRPTANNPFVAGFADKQMVAVCKTAHSMPWGTPAPSAILGARVAGADNEMRYPIFGYEAGAAMVGGTAPAKRVGFFLSDSVAADGTADAWKLFDAAIDWALKP